MAHAEGRLWQSPPPFGDRHADTQILRVGVLLFDRPRRKGGYDTRRGRVTRIR